MCAPARMCSIMPVPSCWVSQACSRACLRDSRCMCAYMRACGMQYAAPFAGGLPGLPGPSLPAPADANGQELCECYTRHLCWHLQGHENEKRWYIDIRIDM